MAEFFTQEEWLGVRFKDLKIPLDEFQPAGSNFYLHFYKRLQEITYSYADLPSRWRQIKIDQANSLAPLLSGVDKVLSYGCGLGYLESVLDQKFPGRVYVSDYSQLAVDFYPPFSSKYFGIEEIPMNTFSHVLLNQVSYSMNTNDLKKLILRLHYALNLQGQLLITFSLSDKCPDKLRIITCFKRRLRTFILFGRKIISELGFYSSVRQGWGWHRSLDEMLDIVSSIGLNVNLIVECETQTVLVIEKTI